MVQRRGRVIVAKMGLDTHDVGAKLLAQAFRDAGMEVIYLGDRNRPDEVAAVAVEEDVDVVGVSLLSGAHRTLVPRLLLELERENLDDVGVLIGGTIPAKDGRTYAADPRVLGVFGPGSSTDRVIEVVREHIDSRHAEAGD